MVTYRLTGTGRLVTWKQWRKRRGCGLPHIEANQVAAVIGPEKRWDDVTLGQIADACPAAGRGLARYAATHLKIKEWAVLDLPHI